MFPCSDGMNNTSGSIDASIFVLNVLGSELRTNSLAIIRPNLPDEKSNRGCKPCNATEEFKHAGIRY